MDTASGYNPVSHTSVTYPGGWTCTNCGSWVASGTSHYCTWHTWPQSVTRWTMGVSDVDVDRIARRVIELLREQEGES